MSLIVMTSLTIEKITILRDTFIKLLVDEVNNLKHKHVRDILIDGKGDEVPESEDNAIENYKELETQSIYLKLIMVWYV